MPNKPANLRWRLAKMHRRITSVARQNAPPINKCRCLHTGSKRRRLAEHGWTEKNIQPK
ncbi:MAG: hypothetical protein ACRCUY_14010 [Thermoguttaceae bacterium]